MHATLRAYADLFRLKFFIAWPLLFCSGYLLATVTYGGFSWPVLATVALIGFFGFEAGLVLNDYIDRTYDCRDVDRGRLTKYWRVFGTRPVAEGLISPRVAAGLVIGLVVLTAGLVLTLPYPNSMYVFLLMFLCYALEIFYQEEKREQKMPFAQVIGRVDLALFVVAGYLTIGQPDTTALLLFLFFYPFALAHLGQNYLVDEENDRARGMKSIPVLYGTTGTVYWITLFVAVHAVAAFLFMTTLGWTARLGILAGLALLFYATATTVADRSPDAALRVLPCFHGAMALYALGIGAGAVFGI